MLTHKTILFIAPLFHDYEQMIIRKLRELGAEVVFFPERDYSFRFKAVNNFCPGKMNAKQQRHYARIAERIKNIKFDYLFVIRGYKIPGSFIDQFRKMNPEAKTIMYQWDSNRTNSFVGVVEKFDRVLSFDYEDCDNLSINYLPLFYTDDVATYRDKESENSFDLFFMGSYIPERYQALIKFRNYLKGESHTLKSFIYIPRSSLLKERIKGTKLDGHLISSRPMPHSEYLDLLSQSKAVVDVSSRGQTGMAMRIIEALTMRKKVVTDNANILREPFYDSANIYIFNADEPFIPEEFLRSPFQDTIHTLSIKEWLEVIFSNHED